MRLHSFQVQGFKSIIDSGVCQLPKNDGIMVLAGQNEAGKSAVIEALRFFQEGKNQEFERLYRRRGLSPLVACWFELEEPDIQKVHELTNLDSIHLFFQSNPVVKVYRDDLDGDKDAIYWDYDLFEKLLNELKDKDAKRPQTKETENQESQEKALEAKMDTPNYEDLREKVESYFWESIRDFIFYDSFEDILPGEVKSPEIDKYMAVKDFEKVFNVDFKNILKSDERSIASEELRLLREASDNLNEYWQQKLEEACKYNFRIKIQATPENPQLSKVFFMIDKDDGNPLYMEQTSKGFRWFSAFNLRLRALGVNDDEISKLVILIDEPGQGLSEKAQRDVKRVLEELAQKGAQIIYTTHCPNLIGVEGKELSRIRLVSNTKTHGTKIETITQYASRSDTAAKDTLSPIITAMGIHSIGALLDYKRRNVVVEGISDHYYLTAFRKLLNKSDSLYFLPACGVNNVPQLVSTLIGWGLDYKAVFDDDARSGRKAYNDLKREFYGGDDEETHKHVYKIKDCKGIEDVFSKNDFKKYVATDEMRSNWDEYKSKSNSEIADGRKELLSRLFIEVVDELKITDFTEKTRSQIQKIFDWLYKVFELS